MRIFERLREDEAGAIAPSSANFSKPSPTIFSRKLEDETSVPVLTESKANCCSCCSAEEEAPYWTILLDDLAPDQPAPIASGENNR